jgi:hypothetical protein
VLGCFYIIRYTVLFSGSAFDMDEVIILLVRRTVEQRNAICTEYEAKYEKVWIRHVKHLVICSTFLCYHLPL